MLEIEVLHQTEKSRVALVECDGKRMVRKELAGVLSVYEALQGLPHRFLPVIYRTEVQGAQTIVLEEYIEGTTLAAAQLPHKKLVVALRELCVVLDYLHQHDIVHRDIKPSNILLAKDGHIRLIDFDAARIVKEEAEQDTRMLGTRGYAPPEQYGFSQTDQRADIYALGITMQTLLGSMATRYEQRAIKRCTALNPKDRYASTLEVKKAISCNLYAVATVLVIVLLAGLGGWLGTTIVEKGATQPKLQTDVYSQDLLVYADNSQYIYTTADLLLTSSPQNMSVDMDNDGTFETFSIDKYDDSIVCLANRYDAEGVIREDYQLLWGSLAEQLLYQIPLSRSDFYEQDIAYQITCIDVDTDGVKELLVSKGDKHTALVTELYRYSDGVFSLMGTMWGFRTMRVAGGNIYTDFDTSLSGEHFNLYKYFDSMLMEIRVITPEAYHEFEQADAQTKHEMIAGRKSQ